MPKDRETSNHPCHFLSLPSARRFWCRHCMSVFEDAITRWRHSRTCRYGVVSNFMRRRELEAKALQNTTKPNPIEARLEQSVEVPALSTTDESGADTEGSSSQKGNQDDKGALFRCFICQSQFSSLEEMRHHVKFPCNHKSTVAEDNQSAMTIYIDEFTDRSRPWDPAPQPQQEEVYTSEYVPALETQQSVNTNIEVATGQEESMITAPSVKKQENITPTNIYVNEQGETVIEVENLDLNSEGGELSLAHLLTQLSQQGIVFDKSKTGQMQARQEMTVSDPSSGKIYTTSSTLNYPSIASDTTQEDDEGQPTAEDAANTLAQLAGFRGFRNSQDLYEGTQLVQNQLKSEEPHIIEGPHTYEYGTSIPEAAAAGNPVSVVNSQSEMKVKYEYEYYPSAQTSSSSTDEQIAIQTMVQSGSQEYDNMKIQEEIVHPFPVQFYEDRSNAHEVTYITTQAGQQAHSTAIQTLDSENVGVNGQRVIIDHGSEPVIIQQYGVSGADSTSQQFVNFPVQLPAVSAETQNSNQEIFHHSQNTAQAVNSLESSEEVLGSVESSLDEGQPLSIDSNHNHSMSHPANNVCERYEASDSSEQAVKLSELPPVEDKEAENNGEEFTIQTVSLQEIVEAESSNSMAFVNKSGVLAAHNNAPNSQIIQAVESNHLHSVALDSSANTPIIHSVDSTGNLAVSAQPDIALTDKFVITDSQSSLDQNKRPSVPIFVVSSSGLQLVGTEQKNAVTETQTDL